MSVFSGHFGYDREVLDMPVLVLVGTLIASGLMFAVALPALLSASNDLPARDTRRLTIAMLSAGVAARLILFTSEPMLEDDYQRYLWDGAVTASGLNPYAATPASALKSAPDTPLGILSAQSGFVLQRVNHPHLTTIYPPFAQAAFAIAHMLAPWSLTAWRGVLLIADGVIVVLLITLLKRTGRSPLYAALYWLNPLVLKEGFNSAHMEPLLLALVLLVLWLSVQRRPFAAVLALSLATAVKLWPVLLLPLIVRPLIGDIRRLAIAVAVFSAVTATLVWPLAAGGLSEASGLRAYAENWKTNSALFPLLENAAAWALPLLGVNGITAALAIKAVLATGLGAVALHQARAPILSTQDILQRAGLIVAALVLVSPAQYPWYLLWLVPFLAFRPIPGFLLLGATIPLYYASFHFAARETLETAGPVIVALIWLPVWGLLFWQAWQASRASTVDQRGQRA